LAEGARKPRDNKTRYEKNRAERGGQLIWYAVN
jgi:hypothetical protein